jgi:DNA polymerase-3 subunit epsilon
MARPDADRNLGEVATVTEGYAVIDTETTGILPGWHHRIAEIAVIHLDHDGNITDEWCTLVNPERDLGPQRIHGIRAAEVRKAPTFQKIAGELIERLRGRAPVAHNWAFDAMHLRAEFARIEVETPFLSSAGLCTMNTARGALPGSRRSLSDCCMCAGLSLEEWHTALADARAAGALLHYYLANTPELVRLTNKHMRSVDWRWPRLPSGSTTLVRRRPCGHVESHFLARMVDRVPRATTPTADGYLAMLDAALLDRHISATEGDALVDLAYELGLHTCEVVEAHLAYLQALTRAAWLDGVVTKGERADLHAVAGLLGLAPELIDNILSEAANASKADSQNPLVTPTIGGLTLQPGDKIVLTGEMTHQRQVWVERAIAAGLRVTTGVSRQTRVLVAADPDSLSGKAKDARKLGVPVVDESAFANAIMTMRRSDFGM